MEEVWFMQIVHELLGGVDTCKSQFFCQLDSRKPLEIKRYSGSSVTKFGHT